MDSATRSCSIGLQEGNSFSSELRIFTHPLVLRCIDVIESCNQLNQLNAAYNYVKLALQHISNEYAKEIGDGFGIRTIDRLCSLNSDITQIRLYLSELIDCKKDILLRDLINSEMEA